jgi:hypothetical protein
MDADGFGVPKHISSSGLIQWCEQARLPRFGGPKRDLAAERDHFGRFKLDVCRWSS